jgi:hypothetical protein
MQRITLENQLLKNRVHKTEKQYPLRAAAAKIQEPPSPNFSMDSGEAEFGSKDLKRGFKVFNPQMHENNSFHQQHYK